METRAYNRSVEGLRGLAALLVVMSHCLGIDGFSLGVDLFFVLSGFLITRLIVDELSGTGRVSLTRFYVRRAFRLLPALLVLLAAVLLWAEMLGPASGAAGIRITAVTSLLYVENWHLVLAGPTTPGLLTDPVTHTWSLSVEEQFYLVWPLLLIGAWRWRGARGALIIAAAGVALATADRLGLAMLGTTPGRVFFSSDMRADQLLAGCCVALLAHRGLLPRIRPGVSVAALGVLVLIGVDPLALPLQMSLTTLLGAVLVAGLSQHELGSLGSAPAVWLGRRSYAIYLWHPFVRTLLHDHAHLGDGGPMLLAVLLISLAVADVTYRTVERPLRAVGRRLTSERRPPLGDAVLHATLSASPVGE